MAHIRLPKDAPGIIGPMTAYPETEVHLNGLAEALMRGPSSLTTAERELIAAHVSNANECTFCANAHAAVARELYGEEEEIVDLVLEAPDSAPISQKMRSLLAIAEHVRRDGRQVSATDVARARADGADDKAIHDTVLIAAAFSMFNRYVDGLATWTPEEDTVYEKIGKMLATDGYVKSIRR